MLRLKRGSGRRYGDEFPYGRPFFLQIVLIFFGGLAFGAIAEALNLGFGPFPFYTSKFFSSSWCWILAIHFVCTRGTSLPACLVKGLAFLVLALIGYITVRLVAYSAPLTPPVFLYEILPYLRGYLEPGLIVVFASSVTAVLRAKSGILGVVATALVPAAALGTAVRYLDWAHSEIEHRVGIAATAACGLYLLVAIWSQMRLMTGRRTSDS